MIASSINKVSKNVKKSIYKNTISSYVFCHIRRPGNPVEESKKRMVQSSEVSKSHEKIEDEVLQKKCLTNEMWDCQARASGLTNNSPNGGWTLPQRRPGFRDHLLLDFFLGNSYSGRVHCL